MSKALENFINSYDIGITNQNDSMAATDFIANTLGDLNIQEENIQLFFRFFDNSDYKKEKKIIELKDQDVDENILIKEKLEEILTAIKHYNEKSNEKIEYKKPNRKVEIFESDFSLVESVRFGILTKDNKFFEYLVNKVDFNISLISIKHANLENISPTYNNNELTSVSFKFNNNRNITIQDSQTIIPGDLKEFNRKLYEKL